ncbi:dihydrodipicolinate synthase family protein [Rhizobium sp. YIM 134829]|uniref:dihydrodipicolinate synthase family protein n=1 Tax=Rhizobium sp. YIM 134829 TaxID=3390453 RepID=UPI00397D48A4
MGRLNEMVHAPTAARAPTLQHAIADGVMTDLVTPFRWGAVDLHGLRRLVEWQIRAGVAALSPCGLMGEGCSLSDEERVLVIRACLEAAGGAVPVIPATGTLSTETTIALTRTARELGASAALITVPFYSKPTQAGILQHMARIVEAVDLPVIVVDRPERTAVALAPETMAALAGVPGVVGLVTARPIAQLPTVLVADPGFTLLSSTEEGFLGAALAGIRGLLSQVANVYPETVVALQAACREGRIDEALCLKDGMAPMIEAFGRWGGPTVAKARLKASLSLLDTVRLPLVALSLDEVRSLEAQLSEGALEAV